MKRMLRRIWATLYHTISFVCFALAIVMVFLWIRSYWIHDRLTFPGSVAFRKDQSPDGLIWNQRTLVDSRNGKVSHLSVRYRTKGGPEEENGNYRKSRAAWSSSFHKPVNFNFLQQNYIAGIEPTWSILGFSYTYNDEIPREVFE